MLAEWYTNYVLENVGQAIQDKWLVLDRESHNIFSRYNCKCISYANLCYCTLFGWYISFDVIYHVSCFVALSCLQPIGKCQPGGVSRFIYVLVKMYFQLRYIYILICIQRMRYCYISLYVQVLLLCMYIHQCISLYVCMYIYLYIYISLYMFIYVYLDMLIHIMFLLIMICQYNEHI